VTRGARLRRTLAMAFWRVFNPLARRLAGVAPWWVVLETRGCRSGVSRQIPLARGPVEGRTAWLIAVHGRHASFVRNIVADSAVRLKIRGRWQDGVASVEPLDPAVLRRFNPYARMGPRTMGIDAALVRVDLAD
jgi:deazaflavin-dependent oxidoreductase (nitroreductase family)